MRDAKAAKAEVKSKKAQEGADRKAEARAAREKEKLRRARRGPKPQMGAVAEAAGSGDDAVMCATCHVPPLLTVPAEPHRY